MTRLAVIDVDGVLTYREARLALAREVYVAKCREEGKEPLPLSYAWNTFDRETFCNPENLYLDTLIPGTNDALNALIDQGYTLVFLSSRSESMRADTVEWFALYVFIRQSCEIILKAEEDRYQKTTNWKAVQVQHLAAQYQPSEILIVDDQENNLNAIAQVLPVPFRLCLSLAEAVR